MLSVQQISPLRVNQGGSVYVFGSGFDYKCKVLADNGTPSQITELSVLDYDETSLEFVAPKEVGSYDVLVVRENILFGRFSLTVVALSELNVWNIARRDNVVRDGVDYENEEFRSALLGLLPRGFAWFKGKAGNWWKLFAGFSVAKRIQAPPIMSITKRAFGYDHREAQLTPYFSREYYKLKEELLN